MVKQATTRVQVFNPTPPRIPQPLGVILRLNEGLRQLRGRGTTQARRKGPVTIIGHGEKHAYEVFVESVSAHHFTNPFYHLRAESRALAQFGKAVRADIDASAAGGDPGTADVFTEISRAADKQLWLAEAHLDSALLFDILQTS